jgi:phospholipid-binding lipoprotein MlaA
MNRRRVAPISLLAAAAVLSLACAGNPPNPEDPWQGFNRPVFRFNEGVDRFVLRPVAQGWTFITFDGLRDSVAKFYYNIAFPGRFVSNVGQADAQQAVVEVARFAINTTVGLVGFFDPATRWGLPRRDEDIGQMFGRWGIPPGPFLQVPLLGPSSPRDLVGTVFDTALSPLTWVSQWVPFLGVPNIINTRARADERIQAARNSSLDFYVFVRDSWVQYRAAAVANSGGLSDYDSSAYITPSADLYELPPEKGNSDAPKSK